MAVPNKKAKFLFVGHLLLLWQSIGTALLYKIAMSLRSSQWPDKYKFIVLRIEMDALHECAIRPFFSIFQKCGSRPEETKITAKMTCMAKITGRPSANFGCLVLWRNRRMAVIVPRLPPRSAAVIRVDSGIRHCFFWAFRLSASISANPSALIRSR